MKDKFIWLDGDLVEWSAATVHVTTFALHYGVGFFEGIGCHQTPGGPALFRLGDHLQRLRRSAAVYGLALPFPVDVLADACKQVVIGNGVTDCYLRPLVFLGDGADPMRAKLRCAVIATEEGPLAGTAPKTAVRAQVSSVERFGPNTLPPAAKATGQYLNAFLAQAEARRTGHDAAILLNDAGLVADGWAHNVFIVAAGKLITPPVWTGGLPGITRDTVLQLAADAGIAAEERPIVRSDLYLAEECFLTGTATGVAPVMSVDGRLISDGSPGPLTERLAAMHTAAVTGATDAHPEWREHVK